MSFDWTDYVDLSVELVGSGRMRSSREARLRCALSRAYYAAFCLARNQLRDHDGHSIPAYGQAHQYVASAFAASADPRRASIGVLLARMRRERNRADYQDNVLNLAALATTQLQYAQRIVALLKTL